MVQFESTDKLPNTMFRGSVQKQCLETMFRP